jgi:hypothetical protein
VLYKSATKVSSQPGVFFDLLISLRRTLEEMAAPLTEGEDRVAHLQDVACLRFRHRVVAYGPVKGFQEYFSLIIVGK